MDHPSVLNINHFSSGGNRNYPLFWEYWKKYPDQVHNFSPWADKHRVKHLHSLTTRKVGWQHLPRRPHPLSPCCHDNRCHFFHCSVELVHRWTTIVFKFSPVAPRVWNWGSGPWAHPDVGSDIVLLAILLQVILDFLVRQEAAQLGVKGEIREHHHLLGKVGSVEKKGTKLSWFAVASLRDQRGDLFHTGDLCTCCCGSAAHRHSFQRVRHNTRCHQRFQWAQTPPAEQRHLDGTGRGGPHRAPQPRLQSLLPATSPCK